jgi:hypothetical protein
LIKQIEFTVCLYLKIKRNACGENNRHYDSDRLKENLGIIGCLKSEPPEIFRKRNKSREESGNLKNEDKTIAILPSRDEMTERTSKSLDELFPEWFFLSRCEYVSSVLVKIHDDLRFVKKLVFPFFANLHIYIEMPFKESSFFSGERGILDNFNE